VRGAGRSRHALTAIAMLAAAALACAALPAKARAGSGADALAASAAGRAPDESSDWDPADNADDHASDADSPSDADSGQVLELPQAVNPDSPEQARSGDAQAGNSAAQEPDQVGNLNEYQSRVDTDPMPVYLVPVVPRAWVAARPMAVNPAMPRMGGIPGMGGMMPGSSIYVPPAGISPIMPASPMLTTPPGSGALPGGWWTRAH
jgi:hypothetical protein